MDCRFCGQILSTSFVDLGETPLCQNILTDDDLPVPETYYPLHAFVCSECFLVQIGEFAAPSDIFEEYAYFSSYSDSWLAHAETYAGRMISELPLSSKSRVIEIASNDGYLLRNFVERGIPSLGIEPARNVAESAERLGVETRREFFNETYAQSLVDEGITADLVIGNNVLAQVPDLNSFVAGLKRVLNKRGVITLEFPHLMRLIDGHQFDTIYHEHFSYFSLLTCTKIFSHHGLRIYDVEELMTHGGSLRLFVAHAEDDSKFESARVEELLNRERVAGYDSLAAYRGFDAKVRKTKKQLLNFLEQAVAGGKTVVGYGAPGKGNTLLNYCGIDTHLIQYTVDRNPYKQGKYLPGSHIPVFKPDKIEETRPDYILILPWNLKNEIMDQLEYVRAWGASFAIPIPYLTLIS